MRLASKHTLRLTVLAAVLYAALTVVLTWPLATQLRVVDAGDSAFFAWQIGWERHALATDPARLPHGNIFHPALWSLAFSENLYGAAVFGFPMFWAGASPLLVYNTLFLLGMFLSAVAGWALAREVTGDAPVALEHDQHDAISIPPGTYQIVRQVEYSPAAIRTVSD